MRAGGRGFYFVCEFFFCDFTALGRPYQSNSLTSHAIHSRCELRNRNRRISRPFFGSRVGGGEKEGL